LILFKKLRGIFENSYLSKTFSYLSLAQAVNAAAGFAVMTIFTRFLTPEDYGRVSMLWLFMTILSVFIDFRLNTAFCIKFYKVSSEQQSRYLYVIIAFNFLAALLAFFVWHSFPDVVVKFLQIQISYGEIGVVCLIGLTSVATRLFGSLLIVSKEAKLYLGFSTLTTFVLIPACIFFLFYLDYGYQSYLLGHLTAYAVMTAVGLVYAFKRYPPVGARILRFSDVKVLTRLSFPLIPDAFLMMLLASAGRYFLNIYHGLAPVAVYSVGYMFANVFNTLILAPLGQAISPVLYEKHAVSEEQCCVYLETIMKYYWVLLSSLMLACFTCFTELFPLLVGDRYGQAVDVMIILMLGLIISGGGSILSMMIVVKEKTHLVFLITLLSVAANVLASLLLIPDFGIYGAAFAGLTGYLFQAIMVTIFTRRLVNINLNGAFLGKIIVLTGVTAVSYFFISRLDVEVYLKIVVKIAAFVLYLAVLSRLVGLKSMIAQKLATTDS